MILKINYTICQTEPDKTSYFGKYFEAFIDADYEPPAGGGSAPDCVTLVLRLFSHHHSPTPAARAGVDHVHIRREQLDSQQVIDHAGGMSGVYTLYADHLGSTSVTADETGTVTSALIYKAWGETQLRTGATPPDYRYTEQREEAELGLYYYNARWYDPALGALKPIFR